jgi:hypothetical protein
MAIKSPGGIQSWPGSIHPQEEAKAALELRLDSEDGCDSVPLKRL